MRTQPSKGISILQLKKSSSYSFQDRHQIERALQPMRNIRNELHSISSKKVTTEVGGLIQVMHASEQLSRNKWLPCISFSKQSHGVPTQQIEVPVVTQLLLRMICSPFFIFSDREQSVPEDYFAKPSRRPYGHCSLKRAQTQQNVTIVTPGAQQREDKSSVSLLTYRMRFSSPLLAYGTFLIRLR